MEVTTITLPSATTMTWGIREVCQEEEGEVMLSTSK